MYIFTSTVNNNGMLAKGVIFMPDNKNNQNNRSNQNANNNRVNQDANNPKNNQNNNNNRNNNKPKST
jgi:hypothetical protein